MTLRSRTRGFLIAVVATAAAIVLRQVLSPWLGDRAPMFTFVLAVIVTASRGGFWPGAFATLLGGLSGVFLFIAPLGTLAIVGSSNQISVGLYALIGLSASGACEILIRARERLAEQQRELEQARLEHRQVQLRIVSELQEADRRKDEFLAILAHELRNPLGPLRNAAHLLDQRAPDHPQLRQPIQMIERQVAQMSRLIEDLMDVSRISHGVFELRLESVDLADVVAAAIEASRHEVEQRNHTLTTRLTEAPVHLSGDRHRLVQVISNLLANATQYTPPGGRIELAVRRDGQTVEVTVADTGVGIAADQLSHIFELFARADGSLERQGGLGIGLSLARRLVELHQGSIQASSDGVGRGSRFVVRLPIVEAPSAAKLETPAAAAAAPPQRILVADDNADAAESLALMLQLAGHEVRVAHDGEVALDLAEQWRPAVAFLDIGMPRANGYEVARRIRERPWGGDIHLIALTGWGQPRDRELARESGFDVHVVKPIDPGMIATLVARARPAPAEPAVPRA